VENPPAADGGWEGWIVIDHVPVDEMRLKNYTVFSLQYIGSL
jgi:hypothetical protein